MLLTKQTLEKVVKKLFLKSKKPKKFLQIKNVQKANIDRLICDFIAGMTDRYAINLYNKIK